MDTNFANPTTKFSLPDESRLHEQDSEIIGLAGANVLVRAAGFLFLADS
jgi:hypothetical protein